MPLNSDWPIWCEIVCLQCAAKVAGQFNWRTMNKPTMKSEAIKNGWKIIAGDWLCKICLEKGTQKCL